MSENNNQVLELNVNDDQDFDLEELEESLQNELDIKINELEFLEKEKEKIGNPDNLGETIKGVVWEQFVNQIGITAAEGYDISNDAHIQTTENFAKGKIATHNTSIDYQKRYDDWQNNFQRNEDGSIRTNIDYRTKKETAVLRVRDSKKDPDGKNYNKNYDARYFIDKDRPKGSKTVNKDHTISAAEIIRDPEAAAHLSRDEQAKFANSDKNLVDLDSRANQSKGDSTMEDWLKSPREGKHGKGESQAEYFGVDEKELLKRDKEARKEYKKVKKEGEKKSVETGRASQKAEAIKVGGEALKAAVLQLFAALIKDIIAKLVLWFKKAKRTLSTLIDSIKEAVKHFFSNIKQHLMDSSNVVFTTILTAIFGPIINVLKKAWMFLKQGWRSLKEAVSYIRNPENKGKPIGILIAEVGKIIIAGLSGVVAIALSGTIESMLVSVMPFFAVEIPMLGSLASLIGIFLSAVVSGIMGAIAINKIDKYVSKKLKDEKTLNIIDKANEVLVTQGKLAIVVEEKAKKQKIEVLSGIKERHNDAVEIGREMANELFVDNKNEILLGEIEELLRKG